MVNEIYQEFRDTIIPSNFISLLETKSKKEQIRLLKSQELTVNIFMALLFKAADLGYNHSFYQSEHLPNGINIRDLPDLINFEDGKLTVVGKTSMSVGQLKALISQRKVIIAKFLDRGKEWHCFLLTYDSILGKESWRGGQPHYHYLSDKWGLPREEILNGIKSGKYKSTEVHIILKDYKRG